MTRMRRAISRIAVTWLLCQVATLTLAPTVLWFGSGTQLLECTCTHGDHAICPMHHKPAPGSKLCLMGSANDVETGVLTSLFGAGGLLPASTSSVRPEFQRAVVAPRPNARSLHPVPPDPPPPRL